METRDEMIDRMVQDGLCRADAEACLDELIDRGLVNEFVDGQLKMASLPRAVYYRLSLWAALKLRNAKRAVGLGTRDPEPAAHGWQSRENMPECYADCPYAEDCLAAQEYDAGVSTAGTGVPEPDAEPASYTVMDASEPVVPAETPTPVE